MRSRKYAAEAESAPDLPHREAGDSVKDGCRIQRLDLEAFEARGSALTCARGVALMECETCKADLPKGSTFCNQCGAPLSLACPACGHGNPTSSKFCKECGTTLSQGALTFPAAIGQAPLSAP